MREREGREGIGPGGPVWFNGFCVSPQGAQQQRLKQFLRQFVSMCANGFQWEEDARAR